jgi:Ca2+-binding EF-hand superfamily protein
VSAEELKVLFKLIGRAVSADEVNQLITKVDKNGDGEVRRALGMLWL